MTKQAGRQADSAGNEKHYGDKATHWKTAIYDCNAEDSSGVKFSGQWALLDTLPSFVKTLYRKQEICPTTHRPHFQIHVICHTQQRPAKMYEWIRHTKWIMVKGPQHVQNSINYINKTETTAPGAKLEILEGEKYYRIHELLLEIARFSEPSWPSGNLSPFDYKQLLQINDWANVTLRMVDQDLTWASKLANPALRRFWEDWKSAFICRIEDYSSETMGAFIIEAPSGQSSPVEEDYWTGADFLPE